MMQVQYPRVIHRQAFGQIDGHETPHIHAQMYKIWGPCLTHLALIGLHSFW